jgi:RNA polymerase sigma-70 factor (ECF subfamily)
VGAIEEIELVDRLRAGDEDAFVTIVRRHHSAMVRLASLYVRDRDVAEDVVQESWLGVVRGIEKFEGRSSLKTWLFRIVANKARTAGVRERREVPADLSGATEDPRYDTTGAWNVPPVPWTEQVEDRLAAKTMLRSIQAGLAQLPSAQAEVITLRDVDGLSAEEACAVLRITKANQRVLLHRGHARLRGFLDAAGRER